MSFCRSFRLLSDSQGKARGERGLYFPINHRILDRRVHPIVAEQCSVQSRYRRELRSHTITGAMRQVSPAAWSAAKRPTHFFSLPLPVKCGMRSMMKQMKENVLFSYPKLEPLFIPDTQLHVTLSVFSLPSSFTKDDLAHLKSSVSQLVARQHPSSTSSSRAGIFSTPYTPARMGNDGAPPTSPIVLRFSGIGSFQHGRILFARCASEQGFNRLDLLVRKLRHHLGISMGIDVKGNPYESFVPHITLMKARPHHLSLLKDLGEEAKHSTSVIPHSLWCEYQFEDFGELAFRRIDLCEMKKDNENGYYPIVFSSFF